MDILNIRLKNVYKEFCSYKLTPATAKAKWEDKDPSLLCKWTKIHSLPFQVSLDAWLSSTDFYCIHK